MFTPGIYNKTKISKIWMFCFIFAANDLSDSPLSIKVIMGTLIGREYNKKDKK